MPPKIVIFGTSNILSDLFDCALSNGIAIGKIVIDLPEETNDRDVPLANRLAALHALGEQTTIEHLD